MKDRNTIRNLVIIIVALFFFSASEESSMVVNLMSKESWECI